MAILNADISSCVPLKTSYRINVGNALRALNLPNAVLYLDAGHGGSLGWDANLPAAAAEIAAVYVAAGKPGQMRGVAVNIGGWNSWFVSLPKTPFLLLAMAPGASSRITTTPMP